MKQRKFSGSHAVACLLLAGGGLLAVGCETEPSNMPVITEVKPTTLTVNVFDADTMEGIDHARLVARPLAGGDPIEIFTGSDGIAVLPRLPGEVELKLFPPGHTPMYVNVEADADVATLLTSAVDAEPEVEDGIYIARESGEMILEPNGDMPASLQVRSLHVDRDADSITEGGFGSVAQSYYRGALPEGARITIGASWAPAAGAAIDVYFIDAFTGNSLAKVSGSFGELAPNRVVSFVAPKLDAAPEGMFIVALAHLAPDPEAAEAGASANCSPSGSWNQSCKDGSENKTLAVLNCCDAPSGTCASTLTATVSAAVTVTVKDVGSIAITGTVSATFTCTTNAGDCEVPKLGSTGCGYVVCDKWFGKNTSVCNNHGCTDNKCRAKTCKVPRYSCTACTCVN